MSQRLAAGACAGMSATLVTHPLDVVRLRLSLPNAGYTGRLTAPPRCTRAAFHCIWPGAGCQYYRSMNMARDITLEVIFHVTFILRYHAYSTDIPAVSNVRISLT